jgi:hypothetical protein
MSDNTATKKVTAYKVELEIVKPSDIKDMQKKINQWLTIGLLKKYEIFPVGDGTFLFNMCKVKGE